MASVVLMVTAVTPMTVSLQPAAAFPPGANVYYFDYNVDAQTHMKTLDQTILVPGGRFKGGIDFGTGYLEGSISLPPAKFTFAAGGLVPVLNVTAKITQTKPVTGLVDFNTLTVTATSTFNIQLVSAYATGTTAPNFVGTKCKTSKPVSVTMSGPASLGEASTFSGEFTLPPFKDCGKNTPALNLLLAGPGNTFTATATPRD